jgi:hypothetical protein
MDYYLRRSPEKQGSPMYRAVGEHLFILHQRIQDLNGKLTENNMTKEERERIELRIRAAREALEHYRKALSLEAHT